MLTASTIFKIKSESDFHSNSIDLLSFQSGQLFYALSVDDKERRYFVSTHYSTPFARQAITGFVPASYFTIEDTFGKELPKVFSKLCSSPTKDELWAPIRHDSLLNTTNWISSIELTETDTPFVFNLLVVRGTKKAYKINKTSGDFINFYEKLFNSFGFEVDVLPMGNGHYHTDDLKDWLTDLIMTARPEIMSSKIFEDFFAEYLPSKKQGKCKSRKTIA